MKTFSGIIKRKVSKQINTKYGQKTKFSILLKMGNEEQWIDAWGHAVSNAWQEGQEITNDADSREYKGKTYWTFKFPKNESYSTNPVSVSSGSDEVVNYLTQIMKEVLDLRKEVQALMEKFEVNISNEAVPF